MADEQKSDQDVPPWERHELERSVMDDEGVMALDPIRLRVRQVHALERIADALEWLAVTASDAAEAMDGAEPEDEEPTQ